MADLDDILGDEDDSRDSTTTSENSTIKAIRASERQEKKARREAEEALETLKAELAVFQKEKRDATVAKAFEGVDSVYAELFSLKHEGEITTEAVNAFLTDRGLERKAGAATTETQTPAVDEGQKDFEPAVGVGDRTRLFEYTEDEVDNIAKDDPERFGKLLRDGKIKPTRVEDMWPAGEAGLT